MWYMCLQEIVKIKNTFSKMHGRSTKVTLTHMPVNMKR